MFFCFEIYIAAVFHVISGYILFFFLYIMYVFSVCLCFSGDVFFGGSSVFSLF